MISVQLRVGPLKKAQVMYDLSKMVFLEESSKGYTVRLTLAGPDPEGRDRGSVILKRFPFKETVDRGTTLVNAETFAQHLMDNLLDIIQAVSGKELNDQSVIVMTAEW